MFGQFEYVALISEPSFMADPGPTVNGRQASCQSIVHFKLF